MLPLSFYSTPLVLGVETKTDSQARKVVLFTAPNGKSIPNSTGRRESPQQIDLLRQAWHEITRRVLGKRDKESPN